jgi:hypothetical protein
MELCRQHLERRCHGTFLLNPKIGVVKTNAVLLIWDIYQSAHLFQDTDPSGTGYTTRAHLAEIVAMLGPPPVGLLNRGLRSKEFFDEKGTLLNMSLFKKFNI